MRKAARGAGTQQVAEVLTIEARTVEIHSANILSKLFETEAVCGCVRRAWSWKWRRSPHSLGNGCLRGQGNAGVTGGIQVAPSE